MKRKLFYELSDPKDYSNQKYLAWWSDDNMELEPITCPVNDGHGRTGKRLTDLTVIVKNKKSFNYDVIWTWYSEPLITAKVINIMESEGLTGYVLKPVVINIEKKALPAMIPEYRELFITGKGGHVHPDSGITIKETCEACNLISYSDWKNKLTVDENNWDGSDFFNFLHPGGIYVTERVKKVFEKYQISNVEFTPIEKIKPV